MEEYKLADREHRVRVTSASPLVGQTIGEVEMRSTSGASIVAIERRRRSSREVISPSASTELQADDILFVDVFGLDGAG